MIIRPINIATTYLISIPFLSSINMASIDFKYENWRLDNMHQNNSVVNLVYKREIDVSIIVNPIRPSHEVFMWWVFIYLYFVFSQAQICRSFQKRLHVTKNHINRLGLEKELEGHSGCVNCLEWDSKGR